MRKTAEERFWGYMDKTDTCWLWTGGKAKGYGHFAIEKGHIAAHWFSWKLHYRGRWALGETNGNSKYTKELICKVRSEYPGKTQTQLAKETGISKTQIFSIVRHKQWTHI